MKIQKAYKIFEDLLADMEKLRQEQPLVIDWIHQSFLELSFWQASREPRVLLASRAGESFFGSLASHHGASARSRCDALLDFGLSAWRPLGKFCDKIPSGWYKKEPCSFVRRNRAYNWRRPTLTGPIVPLPSAQESFTSGFGMGPGGSSLLRPPENRTRIYRVMISDCQYCDKCHSLASV